MNNQRQYFALLDVMKFFFAVAIMLAHIFSEKIEVHPIIKTISSLYNFGVPFFFASSSFLFFLKIFNQNVEESLIYYLKYSKRLLWMYAVWSGIYFCFVVTNWILEGASFEVIIQYFHRALVFTTYATIWFLPSLWIGVSMVYFFYRSGLNLYQIIFIALIFYFVGSLGYSYKPLIENTSLGYVYFLYDEIFLTTRNGIFAGFPFAAIGMYIAFKKPHLNIIKKMFLAIFFGSLFIIEAIFIKRYLHTNVDMGIFLLPCIFFLLQFVIQVDLRPRKIFGRLRNLSMLIFLGQRLFITAIPSILPSALITSIIENSLIGLSFFVGLTFIFAIVIESLSLRFKFLKILW